MHSKKNYLIAFLAVTTVAGGVLAWQQYQELIKLRAAAQQADTDRAAWRKQIWTAEKRRTELEDKLTTLEKKADSVPDPEEGPMPRRRGGRFGGRGAFFAAMDNPQIQRLMAVQQKAGLDSRYAALFKSLALTPEQLDKFKDLLVEKRTAMMDVLAAAREQGINPRTDPAAFQKLVADAQASIDDSIKATLGDTGYDQYQNYEKTMPQRNTVDQLSQRLSYTSTPLTDQQADQMVQIMAANAPAPRGTNGVPTPLTPMGGGLAAMFGGGSGHINDTDIAQASGVLAAPQIDALKQIQAEQQAQAQLGKAMRDQFRGNNGGGSSTGGTTSGTTTVVATTPGGG